MTSVIERTKSELTCTLCGGPIPIGRECIRYGPADGEVAGAVCATCHGNMHCFADHLAGRRTAPLLVRVFRRWWRQWAFLLLPFLLAGTFVVGCRAKQDHSATVAKPNASPATTAGPNRACWLPDGYAVPPGKVVMAPVQAQDDCKFGDFVDILVGGSDSVAKASPSYAVVTNLMVVAGGDAPKGCLPARTVAVECTPEQRELMQGHDSPPRNWARLRPQAGGNAHGQARKAPAPRGVEVIRGTEQETVYFGATNGVALSRRQEEEK